METIKSAYLTLMCSGFDLSKNGAFDMLGEKFHPRVESIITDHVKRIKQKLAHENLLEKYCAAWRDYKVDSNNLHMLFLHYNNWIIQEIKICIQDSYMLDTGYKNKLTNLEDMTNLAWKTHVLEPISLEITSLLWNAIEEEEEENEVTKVVHEIVQSFEQVNADDLLETFFEKLGELYESKTSEWFQGLNAAEFIEKVVQMMEEEVTRCKTFLPERSIGKMKEIFIEKASCLERIDEMMMVCQQMLKENRKDELENLYEILQLLPAESKRFERLSATLRITVLNEALNSSFLNMEEFEANLQRIYRKYNALIEELFSQNYLCIGELQKVLGYDNREDRCDGTWMLVKCMKEFSSSEKSENSKKLRKKIKKKASDLKDLKLIFKKLNLPENLEMEDPNLKHDDKKLKRKKRRRSDALLKKHLRDCGFSDALRGIFQTIEATDFSSALEHTNYENTIISESDTTFFESNTAFSTSDTIPAVPNLDAETLSSTQGITSSELTKLELTTVTISQSDTTIVILYDRV
ncbi:cullin-2-like [Cloeon dipterum]|uniref:cullin-2-like n=1 Tax=Cloeon dipterum TaxID=197152 RepID=UPI0032208497